MGSAETNANRYIGSEEENKKSITTRDVKLSKRLSYLLRYGAAGEGLEVSDEGFVDFMALLRVPMMRHYQPHTVLEKIESSMSHTGRLRFERKFENGTTYVRALYGRRMERNPNHQGSNVPRLLETCLNKVCNNLDDYDLQEFPDEFLLNTMIHKLRRGKRLNNRAFRCLLGSTIEHLDLGAVYLTETTLKIVAQKCPNLRMINLRECGYVATDHAIGNLLKKLPLLETLNLSGCKHITDRTLQSLVKYCPNIQHLSLTGVPDLSQEGLLDLLCKAEKLEHIDITDNCNITDEGRAVLAEFAEQNNITIKLKGLEISPNQKDLSTTLHLAGTSDYW